MSLPILILAGGLATRLRPRTEKIPKSLISIAGKPFIYHQIELLARNKIKEIVISAGYLGEQISDTVGSGSAFGLNISYVFDGDVLLGTGGAVAKALPNLGENFFVIYGDSYLECDYQQVARAFFNAGKLALMTILKNNNKWDVSNVEYNGREILIYNKKKLNDKMNYIDYGLGVFNSAAMRAVSTSVPSDLSEVYSRLALERNLASYEVHNRFYEIGTTKGIEETEAYLLEKNNVSR